MLVLLTSCFYQPKKEELYGTYIREGYGPDTIELKPGEIYIYNGFYDNEKIINKGSWELSENKSEIRFKDFTFGYIKGN